MKAYQIHEKLLGEGISISQQMVRLVISKWKKGDPLVPKVYRKKDIKVTMEHRLHIAEHFRIWDNRGASLQVITVYNYIFLLIYVHVDVLLYLLLYTNGWFLFAGECEYIQGGAGNQYVCVHLVKAQDFIGFSYGPSATGYYIRDKNLSLRAQFVARMLKATINYTTFCL